MSPDGFITFTQVVFPWSSCICQLNIILIRIKFLHVHCVLRTMYIRWTWKNPGFNSIHVVRIFHRLHSAQEPKGQQESRHSFYFLLSSVKKIPMLLIVSILKSGSNYVFVHDAGQRSLWEDVGGRGQRLTVWNCLLNRT